MELTALRTLSMTDQQTFLPGRIATETTSMDAALRLLHAALNARHDIDAFLDAPAFFSTNVKECKKLVEDHVGLDDETRGQQTRLCQPPGRPTPGATVSFTIFYGGTFPTDRGSSPLCLANPKANRVLSQ